MQYLLKYLTSAPMMAALFLAIFSIFLIVLNFYYPGLQYGTYFHPAP
jgi:Photosystem I reaction centre subunit IX / PsaJ